MTVPVAGVIKGVLSPVELTIELPPREAGQAVADFVIRALRGDAGR